MIRPGDLVVVAQGVGEPTVLLETVLAASPDDVDLFVGLSHSAALAPPAAMPLLSFGALGPLGAPAHRGRVGVIPAHFDDLPRVLRERGQDIVVLIQVGPVDADGTHGLGMAVDHTYELLAHARVVVAEVNDQMPPTASPRIAAATFDAVVETSRPLPVVATPPTTGVHDRIAEHVAGLVPDEATLQLGIGAMAFAIGRALSDRVGLSVRSTLVGDWLLELERSGSIRTGGGAVVISEAAGSAELYDLVTRGAIPVRPVADVVGPAARGEVARFVAVNSALEVDLTGQVNAEALPTGYIGGIGGQSEFLRAGQRSPGGRSIVALPATAGRYSRIVGSLTGDAVTSPRSNVDFVVTEHGVADLRGRSLAERADALIAIAAPEHRTTLKEGLAR
nr:acetyl-CoA hydrolase/transferase C-terminal domain-containing protein [Gordonia humi]